VAHCLTVCFRMAGLKLPVSCCCNSSVHCSTGPQQNVDDDYCVSCVSGKGSRRGGLQGIHILGAPTFFLNRGPAWSKFGPGCYYTHNYLIALCPGLPRWAGTRRNIHPLTLILVIRHALSTSSIYCDP